LHHDVLSRFKEVLDLSSSEFASAHGRRAVVLPFLGHYVGEGQVSVTLKSDVYKRGVHAGEYVLHDSLEDGSDDSLLPLHSVFGEVPVF
jgi:hypothetical protein